MFVTHLCSPKSPLSTLERKAVKHYNDNDDEGEKEAEEGRWGGEQEKQKQEEKQEQEAEEEVLHFGGRNRALFYWEIGYAGQVHCKGLTPSPPPPPLPH